MATAIKVDGRSLTQVRKKIRDMRMRTENLMAAWEVFLDWFADANRVQFGSRGARWRTVWPELAPSTVADKRREGFSGGTLIRTTDLLRSLSDRPLGMELILPHEMQAGTRVSYAGYHQFGTRHMPRRRLIDADEIQREHAISSVISSWIVTGHPVVRASS